MKITILFFLAVICSTTHSKAMELEDTEFQEIAYDHLQRYSIVYWELECLENHLKRKPTKETLDRLNQTFLQRQEIWSIPGFEKLSHISNLSILKKEISKRVNLLEKQIKTFKKPFNKAAKN